LKLTGLLDTVACRGAFWGIRFGDWATVGSRTVVSGGEFGETGGRGALGSTTNGGGFCVVGWTGAIGPAVTGVTGAAVIGVVGVTVAITGVERPCFLDFFPRALSLASSGVFVAGCAAAT
jgi:hypothetical protein